MNDLSRGDRARLMAQRLRQVDADGRGHLDHHGLSGRHLVVDLIGVVPDGQCTHRTHLHALAAAYAGGVHQFFAIRRHDLRMEAAVLLGHDLDPLNLTAHFHTSAAENAFLHIPDNAGRRLVLDVGTELQLVAVGTVHI